MRCPHCDCILEDKWIKRMGAAIMGKKRGAAKARHESKARKAADARWAKYREMKTI